MRTMFKTAISMRPQLLVVSTLVAGLLLVAQPSAVAETPAMLRQEFHETDPNAINCGTFSVTFDLEERLFGIARFQDGKLVTDTDHWHITGTLINQTTLKTINTSMDYTFRFTPPNTLTIVVCSQSFPCRMAALSHWLSVNSPLTAMAMSSSSRGRLRRKPSSYRKSARL
jgi:hypothetical protein